MDRFQQYQRSQEEANRAVIESAIQAMTSKAAAQAQVATARVSGAHLLANRLPGMAAQLPSSSALESLALSNLTHQRRLAQVRLQKEQRIPCLQSPPTRESALLEDLTRLAQIEREATWERLSRLVPQISSPSMLMPLQLPNVSHKVSLSLPRTMMDSSHNECLAPGAKRQRLLGDSNQSNSALQQRVPIIEKLPPPFRRDCFPQPHQATPSSKVEEAATNARVLAMSCDAENLTPYQCLAREQIELFAVEKEDLASGTKGRSRSIQLGQVGIRCRHCAHCPIRERAKGSTIYPSQLGGIYQAAQNMTNSHILRHCDQVPNKIKNKLQSLANKKSSAGGGKEYWSAGAKILGVVEDKRGLRFA